MSPSAPFAILMATLAVSTPLSAATLMPTLGFEDDVDLVAPTTREFLLVPEESEDGSSAQLTIIDLDAAGIPLNADDPEIVSVVGFENGVDPFVLNYGATSLVFVPTEDERDEDARLLVLEVNDQGVVLDERETALGTLGFVPDVDGIASQYPRGVAFFVLESDDHHDLGILAVDSDPTDGDWGACTLVASVAAGGCAEGEVVSWLDLATPAVDPVAYELDTSVRLALPVTFSSGGGDLLLVDFESDNVFTDEPPRLQGDAISAKAVNAPSGRPTSFPGFETDVDLALWPNGPCGGASRSILVPVEAPGGAGDLYLLDQDGVAQWVYSIDGAADVPIQGYEKGVDVVPVCASGFQALLVSSENTDGSDADLLIVDFETGELLTHLEDQAVNPGMSVWGFEVGVEPLLWKSTGVLPMETTAGDGALIAFNPVTGAVVNGLALTGVGGVGWGFLRSVDPLTVQVSSTSTRLYVPIANETTGDANVIFCQAPPVLEPTTIEALNGIDLRGFAWDVDLGVLEKSNPGEAMVALPEENAAGDEARLRFEEVPSVGPYVIVAVGSDSPPRLDFFRAATAQLARSVVDLLGLETGLDLAAGSGSLESLDPPRSSVPSNFAGDTDTDPTLGWLMSTVSVDETSLPPAGPRIRHAVPFRAGSRLRIEDARGAPITITIFDTAGRRVRSLFAGVMPAGELEIAWDGLDDGRQSVAAGVYFVHATGAPAASRLVLTW
jgi:hypothetical protein